MADVNIKDYVHRELSLKEQEVALDFISYLENNGMTFLKDNCDYWKDKIYYWIKYSEKCVCFIAIKNPDEIENNWTIWSDDIGSEWLEKSEVDALVKETAWKHVDYCKHCGSCGGGREKIIFGRKFNNVCGCTFRVDNPTFQDLVFLKKMVEIRKEEILDAHK